MLANVALEIVALKPHLVGGRLRQGSVVFGQHIVRRAEGLEHVDAAAADEAREPISAA